MRALLTRYAVGVGSGLAAGPLFLAGMRGAPLAVALAYLGPLPVMIAALGWGWDAGLVALFAASGVAAAGAPVFVGAYDALIVGPAWLIAACTGAPTWSSRKVADAEQPPVRAYPGPGAIALLAAALS